MESNELEMSRPVTEIDHGFDEYTDEELLEQSQFNAQALLMATALALPDAAAREAWINGVAEAFARNWDAQRAWEPAEILDSLLTNYRSFGAHVIEARLQDSPATAVIADLPDLELAESIGADDEHADTLFAIGEKLVAHLGRTMTWERDPETGDVTIDIT